MPTTLSPQVILVAYWLVVLVIAAFSLRMACSLCKTDLPSWRRAFVSVLLVTFLAYLTFDFTCYLIMRSMDEVMLQVPQGYTYGHWFREPITLKWYIVSHAGPLKYLPWVFGLCAAGLLQVVVLQAQVSFRFGLILFLLQWVGTIVGGYIVSLIFGVVLSSIGWKPPEQNLETAQNPAYAQAPQQGNAKSQPKRQPNPSKGTKTTRPDPRSKRPDPAKKPAEAPKEASPDGQTPPPTSLQSVAQDMGGALQDSKDYLAHAGAHLKVYADAQLEDLKQAAAPVTEHLPKPVQRFLDEGGWWVVLGACALLALFWLRAILRKLMGIVGPSKRKKKRKKRTVKLREDVKALLGGLTEGGQQRIRIKGYSAQLRLVILSMGTKSGGGLSEDMADRVLDWIEEGFAEAASDDYPGVRVWPPFYSFEGFAITLQNNVPLPEPLGMKSHWVLLAGTARIGKLVIHVGLVLYTEKPTSLRFIKVKEGRWSDALTIEKSPELAAHR